MFRTSGIFYVELIQKKKFHYTLNPTIIKIISKTSKHLALKLCLIDNNK